MRHVTDAGLALIKPLRELQPGSTPSAGYETIGYGHVVLDGERERFANDGISEDEAQDLLRRDAGIAERAVLRLITVPLTDGQFDALSSFAFNLGGGALQRSTLRRKVNREEHALVPHEFEVGVGRWAEAKGLVPRWEADAVRRGPAAIGGLQPRPAPIRHTLWSELISGSLASWDRCALSASTTPVPGRQI